MDKMASLMFGVRPTKRSWGDKSVWCCAKQISYIHKVSSSDELDKMDGRFAFVAKHKQCDVINLMLCVCVS